VRFVTSGRRKLGTFELSLVSTAPSLAGAEEEIKEDYALAFECLNHHEQATYAVIRTWDQFETTKANLLDNRRSRYQAEEPRGQYKPFTQDEAVRRKLLLSSIRRIQISNERKGRPVDEYHDIRCLSMEIALAVIHHNIFYAAVAMTRVIALYPASETLKCLTICRATGLTSAARIRRQLPA